MEFTAYVRIPSAEPLIARQHPTQLSNLPSLVDEYSEVNNVPRYGGITAAMQDNMDIQKGLLGKRHRFCLKAFWD